MGNSLDSPITTKDGEIYRSSSGLIAGATGMQGWRLEMEDSHVTVDIPTQEDHMFLAVFDGHAGAGAAKYASEHIIKFLLESEHWKMYQSGGCQDIELLGKAMTYAFETVDYHMKHHQDSAPDDVSGCTSVTAIITPKYIICANAGDSRCVLGTGNTTKPLSEDHKPYGEIEKKRIENAGGFVQWNRVDGDLAVSRALGDFSYKNRPDFHAKDQKITCYPDIAIHERDPTDDVLLLACDGLWDVLSSEEAINTVRELYESGEDSVLKIAEEMLDISLDKGSKDNISAVVVKLAGAKIGPASNGGIDARRERRAKARESSNNQHYN